MAGAVKFEGILSRIRNSVGTLFGPRGHVRFNDSATVTWTITDDPGNDEIDVSAAAAGGAGHAQVHAIDGADHTGDIETAQVADNAITLAKMADIATARILGRTTAATGDPEALTSAQATALLDVFTSALKGLVPPSGGDTTFLRADGTWVTPGGGDDARLIVDALTADQADITGITLVEIAGLTQTALPAGTYQFKYHIIYQATATTTGIDVAVDHSGTVTAFVATAYQASTGGTASTGIGDQVGVAGSVGLMEGKGARVKNTKVGATVGVDTANADILMIVEGTIKTTTPGDLKLMVAAEAAGLVVRVTEGSSLVLVKVA